MITFTKSDRISALDAHEEVRAGLTIAEQLEAAKVAWDDALFPAEQHRWMNEIARLEKLLEEEEKCRPSSSVTQSNGLVFAQPDAVTPVSYNKDTRPSGSPIRYNYEQPGREPMPPGQYDPNPPPGQMQFCHSDQYQAQAYLNNRCHEHPRPAHVRRDTISDAEAEARGLPKDTP